MAEILVPPDSAGRPGETIVAHSRSLFRPRITPDGTREDFRVLLSQTPSTLAAVCLGPVSERGTAEQASAHTMEWMSKLGFWPRPMDPVEVAGQRAMAFRVELATLITAQWHFVRDGWVYVIGIEINPRDDERAILTSAQAVLSSWRWEPRTA